MGGDRSFQQFGFEGNGRSPPRRTASVSTIFRLPFPSSGGDLHWAAVDQLGLEHLEISAIILALSPSPGTPFSRISTVSSPSSSVLNLNFIINCLCPTHFLVTILFPSTSLVCVIVFFSFLPGSLELVLKRITVENSLDRGKYQEG